MEDVMTRVVGSLDNGRVSFGDKAEIEDARATDQVCGAEMIRADAAAATDFHGRLYFFCSRACKQQFDADPERYGAATSSPEAPR
jgi:YHS domain-containing protein